MYDLISILREAAEQDAIFSISKIEVIGDPSEFTYKFYSCGKMTHWLRPCMYIYVGGEKGEVQEVVNNECVQIVFENEIDLTVTSFSIPHGTFVYGTQPMADVEIDQKEIGMLGSGNPMPLIYFQEIYRTRTQPLDSPIQIIGIDLRIFFLNDYEQDNAWLTSDHYKNIVDQMVNYSEFFVQNLKDNTKQLDRSYLRNNSYDTIPRVKTGDYVKNANVSSIFARNLSGAELVIDVPVKKDKSCC